MSDNDTTDCPICLCQLNGELFNCNTCRANFHTYCMGRWITRARTCPNCRGEIVRFNPDPLPPEARPRSKIPAWIESHVPYGDGRDSYFI